MLPSVEYDPFTGVTVRIPGPPVLSFHKRDDTPSDYLTAKQAAAYLNVPYSTFRKRAGEITRTRTNRYRKADLDRWAQGRRR